MKQPHFYWILTFGSILIVLFILYLTTHTGLVPPQPQNVSQVCFGQECFEVEIADSPEEQAKGLMGRESLEPGKGMLFVFPEEGIYPFWMKDTLMPLDMIWMDSQGKVVFIKESAQPCGSGECPSIDPGAWARYVLEVNGGTVGRMGLEVGDASILQL